MNILLTCLFATSGLAHDLLDEDALEAAYGPFVDLAAASPGTDPFRQLAEVLPTPGDTRTASGAPGPKYWQNRADHDIEVTLDPATHRLTGSERITYTNASPDTLTYLWLQLDQNRFRGDSLGSRIETGPELSDGVDIGWLLREHARKTFPAGMQVTKVRDGSGRDLPFTVVDAMMRVDLPRPLDPGRSTVLRIDWNHTVVPEAIWARSRVELLDDGQPIYEVAQWFPRMAAYTDVDGWQHKAFLGRGEFTLEFGDYDLHITVPDTYVVAATGELVNPRDVLTTEQQRRLAEARRAPEPVQIITTEEARANEARTPTGTRTWTFHADDVRDVAWAASPSFLWDAWGVTVPGTGRTTMAMSYWPEEGDPLWSRYSTQAVAHTVEVYSAHTVPYPYPVAISVNGAVGGMEYPMICFNGPRPEEDGTYDERTKYGLISVIIHEVGHNWFPMILNSDERQWTWMDEGLNTFVQFLAQESWSEDYPSRRGEAARIVPYMTSWPQVPVMTNSESLRQFGNNGYAKPATALNVLRETVMGRELFDHAFRTYATRWAFRRPQPADLFRTLEDASGVDLDWFWRGWFYTTGHVDMAVERVRRFELSRDPAQRKGFEKRLRDELTPPSRTEERNAGMPRRTERFPGLVDFYDTFDELDVTPADTEAWEAFLARLDDDERAAMDADWQWYAVRLRNVGGLVMPVPLRLVYDDGTEEEVLLPAELWRQGDDVVDKLFLTDKTLAYVEIDTHREIADADPSNNRWPQRIEDGLVKVDKDRDEGNPMRTAQREADKAAVQAVVDGFAPALAEAWRQATQDSPEALTEALEALPVVASARDPWDRPLTLECVLAPPEAPDDDAPGKACVVKSTGKDGTAGNDDDVAITVRTDGTTKVR